MPALVHCGAEGGDLEDAASAAEPHSAVPQKCSSLSLQIKTTKPRRAPSAWAQHEAVEVLDLFSFLKVTFSIFPFSFLGRVERQTWEIRSKSQLICLAGSLEGGKALSDQLKWMSCLGSAKGKPIQKSRMWSPPWKLASEEMVPLSVEDAFGNSFLAPLPTGASWASSQGS